jgi:cell division protein FtsW
MAFTKRHRSVVSLNKPPMAKKRTKAPKGGAMASRPISFENTVKGLIRSTSRRKAHPLRSLHALHSSSRSALRALRGPGRSALRGSSRTIMAARAVVEPDARDVAPASNMLLAPDLQAEPLVVQYLDMYLLFTVVCLLVAGTVFVYSASMYQSYFSSGNVNSYLIRQILWLTLGTAALVVGLNINYQGWRRFSMLGLGLTALLLVLILVPKLQYGVGDNYRWLKLGPLTVQPGEIGKLALTIYAAHWLSSKDEEIRHSLKGLVPFGIVLGFTTLLIFRQPDLGTAAVISAAMLGMFFVSGARFRHLLAVLALGLPVAYYVSHHGGYWATRIQAWHHPFADQQGVGYQISRALLAFWHGGLTGVGLGNGQLKQSIPAPMTDTIFATIGEETGLVGCLIIVAFFAFFAYRGVRISILADSMFGKLLAAGITSYITFQALLNMLSVTNVIPFTGVPLPFISFGGSSLVVNLLAVGILLNVSRRLQPVPEERSDLTGTYLWWRNRRPYLPLPGRRATPVFRPGTTWRTRRVR